MDSRAARRAAEKAARDLIASRAALVGDLADAQSEHARLNEDTASADARGGQLLADAHAEAARLLQAAHELARDGEQRYTDSYTAATSGGWSPSDLTALGYQPPAGTPGRRRRTPTIPERQTQPDRHGTTTAAH